jgi:porphobilinogen deaminase
METFRLASASSPNALAQTARMSCLLERRLPPMKVVDVNLEIPRDPTKQVGRLIDRLRAGDVDAALCSAVRLPLPLPEGVAIGAVLRDRDPRYHCVSSGAPPMEFLDRSAKVVTCDAIARAQILHRFPRLATEFTCPSREIFDALRQGAWAAACLPPEILDVGSLCGLKSEPIPEGKVLPAVGQGLVALLVRAEADSSGRLADLNDRDLEFRLHLESLFASMICVEPDCVATARATRSGSTVELTGMLADRNGEWLVLVQAEVLSGKAEQSVRRLVDSCLCLARKRKSEIPTPSNWVH